MTRLETDFTKFMAGLGSAEKLILAAYGASGGNVLLCGASERRCFDDGFKALEIFMPDDPVEREAVAYLHGAASAAHGMVGDGTSTTVLLTVALIRAGRALREQDYSAREIVACIRSIAADIIAHMKSHAEAPIEADVISAVTLAMHGDVATGEAVGRFIHKAGESAVIVPQSVAGGKEIALSEREGLVWNAGVVAKALLGNATKREMEDVYVIMSADPMADMQSKEWAAIRHAMNAVGPKSFLLICPDVTGTVLATFTRAASEGNGWSIVGVPDRMKAWEFLSDLAAVIGGKVIDVTKGNIAGNTDTKTGFDVSWFGHVPKFSVTERTSCIEVDDSMALRLENLRADLGALLETEEVKNSDIAKNAVKARLQFLSGYYGALSIPWFSESQFSAVWESIQDGVLAGRAALKGVLPGCSKALFGYYAWAHETKISPSEIEKAVISALLSTWEYQVRDFRSIHNDGLTEYWKTFDTRTGKVVNARDAGIIDSFAVLEAAVNVSVEVSIPVIEANMLIVVEPDKQQIDGSSN